MRNVKVLVVGLVVSAGCKSETKCEDLCDRFGRFSWVSLFGKSGVVSPFDAAICVTECRQNTAAAKCASTTEEAPLESAGKVYFDCYDANPGNEIWITEKSIDDKMRSDRGGPARFQEAAEHGNAESQFRLGYAYAEGLGVEKDVRVGSVWLRKAAEQGHRSAEWSIGYMYEHGLGVTLSASDAVQWWRKAAAQGHGDAQNALGVLYSEGAVGVSKDAVEAVRFFQMAATAGHPQAQFNLGVCYGNGTGVEQSHAKAHGWLRKAADQGNADAIQLLASFREAQP